MNKKAEQLYWAKIKCAKFENYFNSNDKIDDSTLVDPVLFFRNSTTEDYNLLLLKLGIIERVLKQEGLE